MAVIFKHNDKVYQCMSLDKKLKKLKKLRINGNEIDILFEGNLTKEELESKFLEMTKEIKEVTTVESSIKKYYFKSRIDNSIITSIYPTLDNLQSIINIDEYDLYE